MRLWRVLVIGLLALLGALGLLSIAGIVLLGLLAPAHVMSSVGRSPMTWAFPGMAFHPAVSRADGSGWRLAYVLAGRQATIVVAMEAPRRSGVVSSQPTVFLSDSSGHLYQQQQLPSALAFLGATPGGQLGDVTVFAPLRAGTTVVLVRHAVPGGGTTRVAVNMAGLAALAAPIHPTITRVSGRVRVTLATVTRGALLSDIDVRARGFADPGGEVSQTHSGNTFTMMERPPQTPMTVTVRTAAGLDLAPSVGTDPIAKGVVTTPIGFNTPPSGTLVMLTITNFELLDLPPARRVTPGQWSFPFRMP